MTAPLFSITVPTSDPTHTTGVTPLALGGTVTAVDTPVASVQWLNDATGEGGTAAVVGTTWSATVPLQAGLNHVSAWATTTLGEIGGDSLDVTLAVASGRVWLQWDANTESDLAGYILFAGVASRSYTVSRDVGNVTTGYIDVPANAEWYFAARAYNTSGQQSDYSNEIHRWVGTIVGQSAVSIRRPTLTAIGAVAIEGSSALTVQRPRLVAVGTVSPSAIVGYAVVTAPRPTLAASGDVVTPITGYAVLSARRATVSATGTVPIAGSAALSARRPTLSATGNPGVTGTAAVSALRPTTFGTGTVGVTGTATVAAQRPSLAATGYIISFAVTGTAELTGQRPTLSATGRVRKPHGKPPRPPGPISGAAAVTARRPVLAAEGLVTLPAISGVAGLTAPRATLVAEGATGEASITGTAAVTAQRPTLTATGLVTFPTITGIAALLAQRGTLSADGSVAAADITGVASVRAQRPTLSASGFVNAPIVIVAGAMFGMGWYERGRFLKPYMISVQGRPIAPVPPDAIDRGHPIMVNPGRQECAVG